jgi:hypothetical protein
MLACILLKGIFLFGERMEEERRKEGEEGSYLDLNKRKGQSTATSSYITM